MEGPENEPGAVDEEEMITFFMKAWIAWRISNVHIKFHQAMCGRGEISH